ncbi:kremen protein 1 [Eudromia elegans]
MPSHAFNGNQTSSLQVRIPIDCLPTLLHMTAFETFVLNLMDEDKSNWNDILNCSHGHLFEVCCQASSAFGDPHFVTFDGLNFTFKGHGEYTLVESDLTFLRVQGRTQQAHFPNGSEAQVTSLSAVAMQENNSDVIEVRYSEDLNMEVLLNQMVVNFSEQSWMDLKGLFLHSTVDQTITVMFSSGAGVEIRGSGGFLTLTVLLPEKFMNHTQGLFGVMNGNIEDEYTFKNKTTISVHANPQQLFEFGADWAVENGTSLFTYDTEFLLNDFFFGEKHNSSFLPVFFPYEDPADPLMKDMVLLCDSDPFCKFDVLTTRSLQVGNSTKLSHQNHKWLVESLKSVISCGWLDHPANGRKEGTNYLSGSAIHFICNQDFELIGSEQRICQATGAWSGETPICMLRTDVKQVILLGCIFGAVGLVVLARLIFLCRKESKESCAASARCCLLADTTGGVQGRPAVCGTRLKMGERGSHVRGGRASRPPPPPLPGVAASAAAMEPRALAAALAVAGLALSCCLEPLLSECYTANGADYRGTQNQTAQYAGKPCLFWNETFEHPYNTLKYPNGEGGLGEHNYCRNPDGDVSPWCYVAEHEDGVYWKYCEIPSCRMPGNLGCFKDHGEPPPLTGTTETSNKLTIQTCISSCRRQQFKFAGMESGYACFCGNNPDYWRYGEADSTECNSVCFGDHTQPCGGDGRVILFDTLTGACGGNYTSATAVIYSPDFPDSYGTGRVCYWTIQVPGASQIHFNFVLFEIKDAADMVELLDGYTHHVLARFNGSNQPPHSFNISLDFVILYFFSDQVNQAQGFAIRYRAVKDNTHEKKIPVNQTLSEKINEKANLSINAARSSKILYVITTSPSHPSSSMPEWTMYGVTALLILSVTAILAKIFLHISMKSHQTPSATEIEDSHPTATAAEIWSIFYEPSTSISIFKKKLRSQQDDRNPLVGN